MINKELKERLSKIYELVKRGINEAERNAAQRTLDKLLAKHNIKDIDLDSLDKDYHRFTYTTLLEEMLFIRVLDFFCSDENVLSGACKIGGARQIRVSLTYLDYIKVSCAYEYFRRHMKAQWLKLCAGEVKRKRKQKTKNERRAELQLVFFEKYLIASKLYKPDEISLVEITSQKELRDRNKLMDIEGGQYTTQVTNGLLLN